MREGWGPILEIKTMNQPGFIYCSHNEDGNQTLSTDKKFGP